MSIFRFARHSTRPRETDASRVTPLRFVWTHQSLSLPFSTLVLRRGSPIRIIALRKDMSV